MIEDTWSAEAVEDMAEVFENDIWKFNIVEGSVGMKGKTTLW